ncbi:hypothetical protein [uncultured Alistipes sp.]|jgi:Ca2+/Na+ antiporter|uniref:hypothetical protein n=1 Tax=uncultured Alistipes sp. TaxID=538949 RepID=UPI0025CC928F|nr:hypothetical protein [uncultured Alistipes sp.]
MVNGNRQISRIDIFALIFFALLFIVWLYAGRLEWLRYLYLGLAFLYIFVVRIVVYNCRKRKEDAEPDKKNES